MNDAKQWYDVLSRAITQSGNYLPHPTKIKARERQEEIDAASTTSATKKKTDMDWIGIL